MTDTFCAALRELAALLRSGLSLSGALQAWPLRCDPRIAAVARDVWRRVVLGERPERAVHGLRDLGLPEAAGLSSILRLQRVSGCDAAGLIEALAADVERRAGLARAARASAAGPRLSGRLIAGLPLAFVPLVAAAGGWALDRRGALALVAGLGLLLAGSAWIARLMPPAPGADDIAGVADFLAASLRAGASVREGLTLCCDCAPDGISSDLDRCSRRVRLGASWSRSLRLAGDPGLRALGSIVGRGDELGAGIASALTDFASARRALQDSEFDRATRRAPVLMVMPLVLCVLPAFVLLAIVPFLRSLSFGS